MCRVEAGGWGVVGGGRTVQPARSIPEHLSEIFQPTIPEDLLEIFQPTIPKHLSEIFQPTIPEHLLEIFQLTIPEHLSGHRAIISNVKNLPKTTRTNHLVVNFV